MGNNEKSLSYHLKALDVRKKLLGEDHPETARSYHNIGCCYYSIENFEKAYEFYEKAFNLRKKLLGEDHKDTIRSMNELQELKVKLKKP